MKKSLLVLSAILVVQLALPFTCFPEEAVFKWIRQLDEGNIDKRLEAIEKLHKTQNK